MKIKLSCKIFVIIAFPILSGFFNSHANILIPDVPLYMNSTGVKPNFVMTLDDSGSMAWAYVPDGISGNYATARYKSSYYNGIYYSPFTQYNAPPLYNRPVGSDVCPQNSNPADCYPNTNFTAAYINGFDQSQGSKNLSTSYKAYRTYDPDGSNTVTDGSSGQAAYYYLFYSQAGLPRPALCPSTVASQKTSDNCYVKYVVGAAGDVYKNSDGTSASAAQKKQNFANWFSYYRTRNLTLVSGTMSAINGLVGDVRVAWQALNTCKTFTYSSTSCRGWNNPSTGVDNRIRELDQIVSGTKTHRQQLYDWLARFPAANGTPLRTAFKRAGEYFDTTVTPLGQLSPWAENPPNVQGTYHSCRRSVNLLMTDGIWNSDTISSYGNKNSGAISLPSGSGYPSGSSWTPSSPYKDSNSDDVSDIAMHFWSKDLAPTIDNKISPFYADRSGTALQQWVNPKNDPATWQHLTTYAISLGLGSTLANPVWGGNTYSGDYSSLLSGSKTWPATGVDVTPGNAYDLWHAAISGRGQFYSADSGDELRKAFKSVIDSVSTFASSGGGAGLTANSTKVTTSTAVYLAVYSGDWSGSFQAIPVQSDGSLATLSWDAGQLIPYAAKRNIFTLNNGTAEQFSSCTSTLGLELNKDINGVTDGLCARRVAWLRGFNEVTGVSWSSLTNKATFVVPGHGLSTGDTVVISNVTPAVYNGTHTVTVSGDNLVVNMLLASDPGSMSSATVGTARYSAFRDRAKALGDIMNSTPSYSHVDDYGYGLAASTVSGKSSYNAFVTAKNSRIPVVYVGANDGMLHAFGAETSGTNAGRELFAYVPSGVFSNLSKLTAPTYAHKFFVDGSPTVGDVYLSSVWKTYLVGGLGAGGRTVYALDITNSSQFGQSGFSLASFVPSSLIKWEYSDADLGLIFGQPLIAPNTNSQWAAVFGNGYNSDSDRAYLYVVDISNGTLITKVAAGSSTGNGLSTPYLHDSDGDKIPDVAYAGDILGNLWKFVNSGGAWSLGNGGSPLYSAVSDTGIAQPITTAPRVLPHPNGGVMIYFGTGRYLSNSDLIDSTRQSFYGIWDDGTSRPTYLRANLEAQTLTTTGSVRTITANSPDWSVKRGCYVDMPTGTPSERILSSPLVKQFTTINNRVIFTTSLPTSDPCDRGGSSWLMELSASCGALSAPALDTNNDGVIDGTDATVAGIKLPDSVGITLFNPPLWLDGDGNSAYKYITGSKGVPLKVKQTKDPNPSIGTTAPTRVYWKQIF